MILEFHNASRLRKPQERSILSKLVAFGNVGSPFVRFMLSLTDGAEDFSLVFLMTVQIQEASYILDIHVVRLFFSLDSQEVYTLVEDVIGITGFVLDFSSVNVYT